MAHLIYLSISFAKNEGPLSGGDRSPPESGPPMHVIVWMTSRMLGGGGVRSHEGSPPMRGPLP